MRRVGHFEVEWQILVVLVVPSGQNDEDRWHFAIQIVDVEQG